MNRQQTTRITPQQTRVPAKQTGTWTMKAQHEADPVHIGRGQFGVKYVGTEPVQHLIKVFEQHYEIKCDWSGQHYIGITLDWDYTRRQVHLTMPGYIKKH